MRFPKLLYAWSLGLALAGFVSCSSDHADESHDHSDGGHAHDQATHDDHGHSGEAPTVAVTQWTDEMELFMEYPVLVAGESGRFIIHLTVLDRFQPVRAGSVALRFESAHGKKHEFVEEELLREGIFAPTVNLPEEGEYAFTLTYRGLESPATFTIDDFRVFRDRAGIPSPEDESGFDEITFLKEQQWKVPFATADAEMREVKRAVWAIGEVLPSPDAYAEIVAPVDGVIRAPENGRWALPGAVVRRGDPLASIAPPVQGEGWASARLAFEQAERDYERAQRLREREAISERELELARNAFLVSRAGHDRLAGGGGPDVLTLEAPISGKIIDWAVRAGQRVRAGEKLMAIVDPALVWLRVNVYESDFRGLGRPVGAYVNADGESGGWTIPEEDMKVLTTGASLDPVTRTIPVLLQVVNRDGRLTIHESTPIELYASDGRWAVAVPRSALFEDGGLDVVFVQTGGESFEKRPVTKGPHDAGWVGIEDGIRPGERVVTRGGYFVKLASTSAAIGHGHAH
ncbi:MAG: efflux RND transporter periplasmic adaptor subunit [Candidatus Eisenbacteria bacterium]|nr:efflux RND transporter periplasmic adaptor subunit [Candidatus Eisenbacteria bacterium]